MAATWQQFSKSYMGWRPGKGGGIVPSPLLIGRESAGTWVGNKAGQILSPWIGLGLVATREEEARPSQVGRLGIEGRQAGWSSGHSSDSGVLARR